MCMYVQRPQDFRQDTGDLNGDYVNNFASGDVVCNREFFTMTEDRPIVKEVGLCCCCDALVVGVYNGTMLLLCRRDAMLVLFCRSMILLLCRSMVLLLKSKCVVLLLCYGSAVLLLPHVPCCTHTLLYCLVCLRLVAYVWCVCTHHVLCPRLAQHHQVCSAYHQLPWHDLLILNLCDWSAGQGLHQREPCV